MEELVPDTPVASGKPAYSSQADDYETIATAPYNHSIASATTTPSQRLTQPTQIIDRIDGREASPVVQVMASSPPSQSPVPARLDQKGGILSSAIAPSGTRFCPPSFAGPTPAKRTPVLNLDDDGPTYRGGSSDDDTQGSRNTDIKPAMFVKGSRSPDGGEAMGSLTRPVDKFRQITSSAIYDPGCQYAKRPAAHVDSMQKGNPVKKRRQNGPARALPTKTSITSLDDIQDFMTKLKVERMLKIMPQRSVNECLEALLAKSGDFDRALDHLALMEERANASSEDELSMERKKSNAVPAKQQIKAHGTIQDKWSSRQFPIFSNQKAKEESKPRRRLMKGPKARSTYSDAARTDKISFNTTTGNRMHSRRLSPACSESLEALEISDDDSDVQGVSEDSLGAKLLKFFNTCSAPELADLAAEPENTANFVISYRPFESLDSVRAIPAPPAESTEGSKPKGSRGRKTPRPIGEKIVDKCLDMWAGYEAVDSLVAECEDLGRPVATEMKKWGVDVFGRRDKLELASFEPGPHDSGIGTPASHLASQRSDEDSDDPPPGSRKCRFISQPDIMSKELKMKDFQIVGINWLALLFERDLSCILADDMGLGKTCQVIGFLAYLYEKDIKGPHLIVVPSSTIENWLREFQKFCPTLSVMPYYAGQNERAEIREMIEENRDNINVVITTYTIAKAKVDSHFLRNMDFCVCVYDEGHMLKSSKSVLYEKLIRIPARFRLLLTGTPLQNNLQELASLLGFILPQVFQDRKSDLHHIFANRATTADKSHSALLSAQRIERAKLMLKPFVLRRKKHQVIDLPSKSSRVEYCDLHESQRAIYEHEKEEVRQLLADRAKGKKTGNKSANILMRLRQAAIHPLLYRRRYNDDILRRMAKACIKEPIFKESNPNVIFDELTYYSDLECHDLCVKYPNSLGRFTLEDEVWMDSGKVDKLCELLARFKEGGDRTLVFSQFTKVMDILERVLENQQLGFVRLDGQTSVEDRQSILDAFHERTEIPVFLLSTKAGGAGINLACANKVVIFDSSFNPQEDVQAENRAHRVGQTREVEVIRLVTKDTIEEQIHALGQTKLALDQAVVGDDLADTKRGEEAGMKAVEDMIATDLEGETPA